jgi:hypothetical protein
MNDYSLLKDLVEKSLAANKTIGILLILLISANIIIESIRFLYKLIITKNQNNNKRQQLIEEKRLKIIGQLFQSLDDLTLLDKSEDQIMLSKLKEISQFISQNKLFIQKPYQKCTNDILDYFKNILTDFRNKSIEKETKLFNKFCDEFNR